MPERATDQTGEEARIGERGIHVPATVLVMVGKPATIVSDTGFEAGDLAREDSEDPLYKVSRPLKGRFAHIPYSSEVFIREKRKEAELEDR